MFRAMTRRLGKRWHFVSFRGSNGAESRGVVDVIAIRRDMRLPQVPGLKAGDLFDIVLVQLKGGDAADPTAADVARLRKVAKVYRARRIVLYSWKKGHRNEYRELDARGVWHTVPAEDAFA